MNARLRAALLLVTLFLTCAAMYLVLSHVRGGTHTFSSVVPVNEATVAELDRIPWMTPQMAEGIVAGRPWIDLDDLVEVSGIGDKTLEKIRPHLKLGR